MYRTSEGNLVLYAQAERIYLRSLVREAIGRSTILASDHASDLTDALYRGTVFYAYKNTEGEILIRSIAENGVWFRLGDQGGPQGYRPQLVALGEYLILLYAVQNPLNNRWRIQCQIPGKEGEAEGEEQQWNRQLMHHFGEMGPESPSLQVIPCRKGTLLLSDPGKMVWRDSQGKWSSLVMENGLEENVGKQLREAYQKEVLQRDLLIESIKNQYEELRLVAEKYREEAIKWRSKFVR